MDSSTDEYKQLRHERNAALYENHTLKALNEDLLKQNNDLEKKLDEQKRRIGRLNREVDRLETAIEEAEQRYLEEDAVFWQRFVMQVNAMGKNPLELIEDELIKRELYIDTSIAA